MRNIYDITNLIPSLMDEILSFFAYDFEKEHPERMEKKTIAFFELYLHKKYSLDSVSHAQDIILICDALCNQNIGFVCLKRDNSLGYNNIYYWAGYMSDGSYFQKMSIEERSGLCRVLENTIYGCKYTFEKCKSFVIPIVYTDKEDKESIGTGFLWGNNYIVTARHCIHNAKNISFGKIDYSKYKDAKVYYHKNDYVDIALIKISPLNITGFCLEDEVSIFEKVITIGYPKIPGFTCFQTAEQATVSSLPEKRLTVTEGEIAAKAQEIWSKENLFLITAKIKGGNSGGPVVNQHGNCIGIVSALPFAEGGIYDDLGYGTVVPARLAMEMEQNLSQHQEIGFVNFIPYPYAETES